ncbi:hypothetical protein [Bradyrhizobium sp. USDA 336]|uniref:hypothetical protein n=1 Tax=Bradyrhizobium sp. USDA 336 TaxID=3156311 RepID=UPI0038330DF7
MPLKMVRGSAFPQQKGGGVGTWKIMALGSHGWFEEPDVAPAISRTNGRSKIATPLDGQVEDWLSAQAAKIEPFLFAIDRFTRKQIISSLGMPAGNPTAMRTISGSEARVLIENQLAAHGNGVLSVLAQYRRDDAVAAWHETIRAVEEFINLPKFGIADDRLRAWLCAVRLDDAFVANPGPTWLAVRQALAPHVEAPVISRFARVMLYAGAMGAAFAAHGLDARSAAITLDTIGGAVDYFQSRRRHFVSLVYTMPYACSGALVLQPYDALTVLMPQVEHSCIAITGFHQKLALLDALPEFSLEVDHIGAMASHGFETLDDYFLEPERASIHVMAELRGDQFTMPAMEALDRGKIFSAAELRNGVKLIGATYEAFGLKDSEFSAMGLLVVAFARRCRDDYYVEIGKEKFRSMLRAQSELDPAELEALLVNKPSDYATNTNAYQPFLDLGIGSSRTSTSCRAFSMRSRIFTWAAAGASRSMQASSSRTW